MGKLIPLFFAGAGTATASVGGFYLVKGSGGNENQKTNTTGGNGKQMQVEAPKLEFEDLDAFETEPIKSKCVSTYFTNLKAKKDAEDINESESSAGTFFNATSSADSSQQSCLKIEYRRTTYGNNKWSGKFTWI